MTIGSSGTAKGINSEVMNTPVRSFPAVQWTGAVSLDGKRYVGESSRSLERNLA